jgi:Protein of unknown function (DUF1059)
VKAIKLTSREKRKGGNMRAFDCVCDRHLEAADDEKLLDIAQAHVRQDHPEMQLGAEQVHKLVAEKSYDHEPDIWAGIDIPPRAAAYMGAGGMPPSSTRPEPRQKRRNRVQEAEEGREGKKGLVDKIKDRLTGR